MGQKFNTVKQSEDKMILTSIFGDRLIEWECKREIENGYSHWITGFCNFLVAADIILETMGVMVIVVCLLRG
jgi:hypothetical protein